VIAHAGPVPVEELAAFGPMLVMAFGATIATLRARFRR
jgi:hypothetical protein